MNAKQLDQFKAAVQEYIVPFFEHITEKQNALTELKRRHTYCVSSICREIAEREGWSESEIYLAEIAGLMHDIGRFEQIRQYSSFNDSETVDHGDFGFELAQSLEFMQILPAPERELVLNVIHYHNKKDIPSQLPEASLRLLKLVRDADRLDIYRVVLEAFESGDLFKHPEIQMGLSTDHAASPDVVAKVLAKESVPYTIMRTLGDRLLLQVSWLFLMSSRTAIELFHERKVLRGFKKIMPDEPTVKPVFEFAAAYLRERLND